MAGNHCRHSISLFYDGYDLILNGGEKMYESKLLKQVLGLAADCVNGFTRSCSGSCENDGCTSVCSQNCGNNCTTDCETTCKGECSGRCKDRCTDTCRTACATNCAFGNGSIITSI